nr:bZIP transcription factor 17-like [Ipomoea batatas]
MAKTAVAEPPAPPSNLNLTTADELEEALPISPLEAEHMFQNDDVVMDDFDFDFSFDDFCLPFGADNSLSQNFLPVSLDQAGCDPVQAQLDVGPTCYVQPGPGCEPIGAFKNSASIFKSSSSELCHFSADQIAGDAMLLNSVSPELSSTSSRVLFVNSPESQQIYGDVSGYLNVPSPESNGSNRDVSQRSGNENQGSSGDVVLNCPSPESQGSENCGPNVSAAPNLLSTDSDKSVNSSTDFGNNSIKIGVVDQKIKLEELNANINNCSNSMLKRKKQSEDINNVEPRSSKYRKPVDDTITENNSENNADITSEEEEKRKTRLMRNRESAQLSRQRKKHYVEELEDKVRTMHSTIQDLNSKISYIMAENASLRQQMGGNGVAVAPPMPPPGMYPPVMYPWMPCAPPYMVKPQGSQVPLVPIPRLKPQQTVSAPKSSKKVESKKNEPKTKKVASVTFLGLLFFIMVFGGLVPTMNVRYGGMREAFTGNTRTGYYEKHPATVLAVNRTGQGESSAHGKHYSDVTHFGVKGHGGGGGKQHSEQDADEFSQSGNGSVPLAASLYVPRNDKLVKIDGNLIIHSVLASEKAMASHVNAEEKGSQETGLAVPENMAPAITAGRHPHMYQGAAERQRALGSDSMSKDNMRSTGADGRLQQWFREGLAGPMLSSGMCTEVFQFDVSSAIVPATSMRNVSLEETRNTTKSKKGKNRRILNGLSVPLPASSHNISEETAEITGNKEKLKGNNNSLSSMVVSVLVDPREGGDGDVDGVMGKKSLSRIFVVVLVDSVKYVTYSCMLPFKGSVPHLVTT